MTDQSEYSPGGGYWSYSDTISQAGSRIGSKRLNLRLPLAAIR